VVGKGEANKPAENEQRADPSKASHESFRTHQQNFSAHSELQFRTALPGLYPLLFFRIGVVELPRTGARLRLETRQ
jgi:hypothetical protein